MTIGLPRIWRFETSAVIFESPSVESRRRPEDSSPHLQPISPPHITAPLPVWQINSPAPFPGSIPPLRAERSERHHLLHRAEAGLKSQKSSWECQIEVWKETGHFRKSLFRSNTWKQRQVQPSSLRPGLRSEEHTSELQSRGHLVCRLLLEKKK